MVNRQDELGDVFSWVLLIQLFEHLEDFMKQ